MEFNIKVSAEHLNVLFAGLDKMEHGVARRVFDHVLQQVQAQQQAQQAATQDGSANG